MCCIVKEIKLFERKFKVSFIIVLLLSSQAIFHTPPFFVDSMREALRYANNHIEQNCYMFCTCFSFGVIKFNLIPFMFLKRRV